jgi:hypothetical protein
VDVYFNIYSSCQLPAVGYWSRFYREQNHTAIIFPTLSTKLFLPEASRQMLSLEVYFLFRKPDSYNWQLALFNIFMVRLHKINPTSLSPENMLTY